MFAAVWVLIAFALFYFGAHVVIAVHRGTFPPEPRPVPECTVWEDGSARCTLPPSQWVPAGTTLSGCSDDPAALCHD